ncbi:UNVERIFIED_CONTAM: hypothetical protein FKN15_003123 [Acipenser sinensis]
MKEELSDEEQEDVPTEEKQLSDAEDERENLSDKASGEDSAGDEASGPEELAVDSVDGLPSDSTAENAKTTVQYVECHNPSVVHIAYVICNNDIAFKKSPKMFYAIEELSKECTGTSTSELKPSSVGSSAQQRVYWDINQRIEAIVRGYAGRTTEEFLRGIAHFNILKVEYHLQLYN